MENKKTYLFDKPKNVKRLLYFLYGSCTLLLVLDFIIHRHVAHSWENLWGFYPLYGFIGCVMLVLVATWMRTFLMRPEDYYVNEDSTEFDKNASTDKKHSVKAGDHDVDA